MSIPIYQASVPVLVRFLKALDRMLDKAATFSTDRQGKSAVKVEETLVRSRLAVDMFDFARQIQITTDMAKGCGARLAGVEVPKFEDTEASIAELKERIGKTVTFLESLDSAAFAGAESRTISLKTGGREVSFSGQDYLLGFVFPNFYFHLTTAYNILRHSGVEIGKMDLLST
ncbi:MAG: DUF1993 domain-containing protein [Ahniella sp.]|nr:DUF1993 domain-containing protein [Ahniella sp.]